MAVFFGQISTPEHGLIYSNSNVKLKIEKIEKGNGVLYLTEQSLSWKPHNRDEGISIPWKKIGAHGIGGDAAKHVFVHLDHKLQCDGLGEANMNGNGSIEPEAAAGAHNNHDEAAGRAGENDAAGNDDSDNDEGNESDCEDITVIWLMPSDPNSVDEIYEAMKDGQKLNPDSADSISDESDFMDAQDDYHEDDNGSDDIGRRDMRNLHLDDERFADAD